MSTTKHKPSAVAPILFSGAPTAPSPEVFANARKNNPVEYQLLEKAYAQFAALPENRGKYADPKGNGATLEQIWRVFTLFGVETYCYLARSMPDDQLRDISRLVRGLPEDFVRQLRVLQELQGELNISTLHFDGVTGHCIRLVAHDSSRDRFIYHDPWPERSLLCSENNEANVNAQPEGGRWSITAQELERVLFAAFLFPHQHARLEGIEFDRSLARWRESSFFSFFRLKLLDERFENDRRHQRYTAGPFTDSVSLIVDTTATDKITRAGLLMEKTWMIKNFPLALDLAKSFVLEFSPPPDKATYAEISNALWNLRNRDFMQSMQQKPADESNTVGCIHAFMGSIENARVQTDFAHLTFKNIAEQNKHLQEIAFTLL